MLMSRLWLLALGAGLFAGCVRVDLGSDCRYDEPREAVVDAQGASEIRVDARAGSLQIEGSPDLTEVVVDGKACTARRRDLERVELIAERDGEIVRIAADIRARRRASLDLELRVPDSIPLVITDSSGEVEIAGVAGVTLEDSSGEILLRRIDGDVRIDDGSGEIEVYGVAGEVRLEDGSGEIFVADVAGSVVVEEDGSGDLEIREVQGDVMIRDDGSGDIVVAEVGGDFTVLHGGSGDIRQRDVAGDVDLP